MYARRETNVRTILGWRESELVCVEQRITKTGPGTLKRHHGGLIRKTTDINNFFLHPEQKISIIIFINFKVPLLYFMNSKMS